MRASTHVLPSPGATQFAGNRSPGPAAASLAVLACALHFHLGTPGHAAETLLLRGAVVHTMVGPDLNPGQVLIRDGRISAVGTSLDLKEIKDLKEVDLTGKHLYPGLIAASTILGLTEIDAIRATRDYTEVGRFTPEVHSWIAVNPDSELIPVARANGIAYMVPVPQGGLVTGHSALVALDGWTVEDMAFRKPLALHVDWPGMNLNVTPREQAQDKSKWKSPEELGRERRKTLSELEGYFQEAAAYVRARQARSETPVTPSWEALRPALNGEIPVVVQANDFREIRAAVQWARTNQLRLIIAGARDAARESSLLASNRVPVIFEHVFNRYLKDTDAYDHFFQTPGVLAKAGVLTAISTGTGDMSEADIRNLPYHAAQAVAFGMAPEQALRSITLAPAQMFGVADRLGSIESGKAASLVATDGDLLDIRSHVTAMWIAGAPVSLETRHTRLYEKYRRRPTPR